MTDSTSQLNQSGDKLLPMWLSLGIRFQIPSVSGFVLPTLCAWLGVGTRPVCSNCQPIFLSTNPIFLPTNPSFYQKTNLSTNKSSQLATHTYLINPPNPNVLLNFSTNLTMGLYCSTFLPICTQLTCPTYLPELYGTNIPVRIHNTTHPAPFPSDQALFSGHTDLALKPSDLISM